MTNTSDLKLSIQNALQQFASADLETAALALFNSLGYKSSKRVTIEPNTAEQFLQDFDEGGLLNHKNALIDKWQSVDFLFQLTDDEVRDSIKSQLHFFSNQQIDNTIINSYVFLAIHLRGNHFTRTQLATATREVNKLFRMPAMILFRHGDCLTLAIIARRLNKRDSNKDVLEKVTLIRDISIVAPHRGHIEILNDLSIEQLAEKFRFTNFVELQRAWEKTLDTAELNKKFYKEIANWYFWAVNHVRFPKDAGEKEETRNATSVIRLITRLIFVWFLKEKGLIPDDLFNPSRLAELLQSSDFAESTYYKAILQNLFFASLNQEMNTPGKRDKRDFRKDGQNYNITNLYRYKAYFKNPEQALNLFESIPFLNGGLFECLDKPDQSNPKKVLRVDGFSDRADNELVVPDWLFFSEEKEIDLNEVYDTRNRRYAVRGLINILEAYKFTIEENTPIEEEIALDPELLGKVFENLLASFNPETGTTARKQTGSFYTPRDIVDYMVDESLLAYLEGKLGSSKENRDRLRQLLAYTDEDLPLFSAQEVNDLLKAIDEIRVLDPACGSGAFPMGMLHKLVFVLRKLDQENRHWREIQKQRAIKETTDVYAMVDQEERRLRLLEIEEAFENNLTDYGRKLYLIQNCIYGIDIQPIAVQISKLRFFISLVVDQRIDDSKENRGIRPLPNLETKFVAANTLIGIDRPAQLTFRNPDIDKKEAELERVRKKHFAARTPKTKHKYRDMDKAIRAEIGNLLQQDGFTHDVTEKLAAWDPYDQNVAAEFFDSEWMFWLPKGFDIVIGNPPYMRVQVIQQTQPEFIPYYRENFKSAQGSYDLYALFIEKGYSLLNETGHLAYIVPHKFFQAAFGEALRRLLTRRQALRQVVRFGSEQVFEEATTYTCLLFLSAQARKEFDLLEVRTLARSSEVLQAARERVDHPDYAYETLSMPVITAASAKIDWDFSIGENSRILQRLQQHPLTLDQITRKIFVGLQTSADKLYVLETISQDNNTVRVYSKYLKEEVEIESGLVKPFLMGKDVHRYEPVVAKNVVIFPYHIRNGKAELMTQDFIQKHFPKGWKYLKRNENALGERERGRMHGQNFYAYIYPKNLAEFESVKIITPEIALGCQMTLDSEGIFYHTTKVYSFVFKESVKAPLKYLLGLLNSKVLWYFLTSTGYVLRGGYYTFKTEYLKPFPIPVSSQEQERAIATLVDYILFLKTLPDPVNASLSAERRVMGAYFEQMIDGLVYELYFPEEFSDQEKSFNRLLTPELLPTLKGTNEEKLAQIETVYRTLHDLNHPVRKALFFLDSIEAVRVIEAKTKNQ